jgi:hypothetical protein
MNKRRKVMEEKDRVILEALEFLIKEQTKPWNCCNALLLLSRIEVLLGTEETMGEDINES